MWQQPDEITAASYPVGSDSSLQATWAMLPTFQYAVTGKAARSCSFYIA
ncbi:MAG: hypothetical protein U5L01_07240 [Rheinheimera sp.]|nr:hypothetical protein [Rheinheimera sp.]